MKAKEYLSKLKSLSTVIERKLEELTAAKAMLTSVSAVDTSKDGGSGKAKGDAGFVNAIARIEMLNKEADNEIDSFINFKHKIIKQIQELGKERYSAILYKKYVEFKELDVVAEEMKLTYPYIVTLHGYALKEFQDKYLKS